MISEACEALARLIQPAMLAWLSETHFTLFAA